MSLATYVYSLAAAAIESRALPTRLRSPALRMLGVSIGNGTIISDNVFIGSTKVVVGNHCFINVRSFLDGAGDLIVEDYVRIGPYVRILTASHSIYPSEIRRHPADIQNLRTIISRGSWVGMGAQILPGVTVAPGCVIAAGAVVSRSTEANGLYAGVPAKRIKTLPLNPIAEEEVLRYIASRE